MWKRYFLVLVLSASTASSTIYAGDDDDLRLIGSRCFDEISDEDFKINQHNDCGGDEEELDAVKGLDYENLGEIQE